MHDNIPVIGRIYHVVQKDTGRIIKVGSTIQLLHKRAGQRDYRKTYSDCFLREAFTIESSTADDNWFGLAGITDPKKAFAPFLWNLIIAEHLEMLRMKTYKIPDEPRSNQQFPIFQKLCGFDGADVASIGGRLANHITNDEAHRADPNYLESRARAGRTSGAKNIATGQIQALGRKNVETGWIQALGRKIGRKNAETGHLDSIRPKDGRGARRAMELHPDLASRRGRIGIRKTNATWGKTDEARKVRLSASIIGGLIGGRRTAELHPDLAVRRGRISACKQWRINRGKECICGKHNAAKAA